MRDPTVFDRLEARLAALEAKPDLEEPLQQLELRTQLLERALPEDQVVENAQQLGAAGVESTNATKAEVKALEPGPWTALELGAKTEAGALQAPAVRSEDKGAVRFRGSVKAKEAIPIGTTIFTVPAGLRPPATIEFLTAMDNGVIIRIAISAAGVATSASEIGVGRIVFLDTETFNLS